MPGSRSWPGHRGPAHSEKRDVSVASSPMPASEAQQGQQGGAKLLTVVFWIGAGLAPLAALRAMMSHGATGLRVASVLAILAFVLIGLALMLRPASTRVRTEV